MRRNDTRPTSRLPPGLAGFQTLAARGRAPMGRIALPGGMAPHIAEGVAWAQFLDENLDRFRRTLDVPIGARLGCGRFGCVYESSSPWVVKVTRDESEGPVWSYMAELLADEELVELLPSYLRVHDVVRIKPDVIFNDELQPVFGIVREEAEPVFDSVQVTNPRDKYDTVFEIALSAQTLAILGVTAATLKRLKMQPPILYKHMSEKIALFPKGVQEHFAQLHMAVQGTRGYRRAADVFHRLRWKEFKTEAEEALAEEALADMLAACSLMQRLPISEELGTTLIASQQEADLVFRDLHVFNIGWRTHRSVGGERLPQCMVILDPGVMSTPYLPEIREVTLLRNASTYLRNAGMIDFEPNTSEITDVSAKRFHDAFESAMGPHNRYSAYVSHYSIPELEDMRARYLSSAGLSGIAVKDHGDGRIEGTALFNDGDARGAGAAMLSHAIDHAGVNYLECFGEVLRRLYESYGFVVTEQFPFNDEYAPRGWNYGLFGRPDYFMLKLKRKPMHKNPETEEEYRDAVAEMIRNPEGTRARIIESLRSDGFTEEEIRREVAIVEGTVGF